MFAVKSMQITVCYLCIHSDGKKKSETMNTNRAEAEVTLESSLLQQRILISGINVGTNVLFM